MKVLHVIPSLSPTHGGPSLALPLMAHSLIKEGVQVDIATTDDDGPGRRTSVPLGQRIEREGYGVYCFRKQTEFYKVSLPLKCWLEEHVRDYDLVHIHALFSFSSWAAAHACRRSPLPAPRSALPASRVPYIIRPLGVLNRWGMANRRRWVKALSFRFIEKSILRHAAGMHYTSDQEQVEAEAAGATARAFIVPLGLDLSPFQSLPSPDLFRQRFPQATGRKVILFLSRLDPKKGLDLLLPAFAAVKQTHPEALLVIAGSGEDRFVEGLREQARQVGIAADVLWPGFLSGTEKLSAFAAASVFVLPSYSENFGIALVEALAAGLPCVTTDGVAVSREIRDSDAGLVAPPASRQIAGALERLLADAELRQRFGANARRLAAERFSVDAMGRALVSLYERIMTKQSA